MRYWITFLLICLTGFAHAQDETALTTIDIERIQRATVFIIQARSSDLTMTCVGSGTIVRYDGLILTNAHNTLRSAACPGDTLIIAMTLNPDEPPVPRYRAEIVQADRGLDLALVRITREFDGRLIDPTSLPVLPFVELADSAQVALDETISVIGFPAPGNDAILIAPGTITGFLDEPGGSGRAWIKIATVVPAPGTMSGGGAYNQAGQLLGVATTAPVGFASASTECKLLEDTNGDTFINASDACVPIGDFISVLRPVNFARPLIRSAALGLTVETLTVPSFESQPDGEPAFSRLFFAPAVVDGLPSTVIGTAPAGSTSLYLFFDYQNMTADAVYELRVNIDGVPTQSFDLPPVRWSGGEDGLWYIGASGQPYPNGNYEFRLFINGTLAASSTIAIGGSAQVVPGFSNLAFGVLGEDGSLQGNGYVLPTGPIATARFIYQNMTPGTPWTAIWYYNGIVIARTDATWLEQDGANGAYPINLRPENGLPSGKYRVDVYLNSLLSATGDFIIAGAQQGVLPGVFAQLQFVRASSATEVATGAPANTYPDGASALFVRFDWTQITPGTPWTLRWRVDGETFYERTQPWVGPEAGSNFTVQLSTPASIPDGTYTIELLINNILIAQTEASVGIGQLAIDQLAQPGGAQLRGQIVDGETGAGIPGVTFILISEEFSVSDFTWDQEQVYALAVTDRDGRFEIDRSLRLDVPYSAIIAAQGYLPVTADGLTITAEDASPVELYVPLTRD